MILLQRRYTELRGKKTTFLDVIYELDPQNPDFELVNDIAWSALIHEDYDRTPEDVVDLLNLRAKDAFRVVRKLKLAIEQDLDFREEEAEGDGEKNPTTTSKSSKK